MSAKPQVKAEKSNTNGDTQTNGVDEVKTSGPPKAMVKPQVLTHVIEGYVIQEASEPFPVGRSLSDVTSKANIQDAKTESDDEPPRKYIVPLYVYWLFVCWVYYSSCAIFVFQGRKLM